MIGYETLSEAAEYALSDDQRVKFIYAQWYIADYISGTRDMTLEVEGAYARFLMRLYDVGKPLPDNDASMARTMGISTRIWKRLRDLLIQDGKIIARNNALTNSRFEEERKKRAFELRRSSESAHHRWAKVRAEKEVEQTGNQESFGEVSTKLRENFPETSGKFERNSGKKANKINETGVTPHKRPHMPVIIQSQNSSKRAKALSSPDKPSTECESDLTCLEKVLSSPVAGIDLDRSSDASNHKNPARVYNPDQTAYNAETPQNEQGYYANGVAIFGQGWTLPYAEIDRVAAEIKFDPVEAHKQALVAAEHWTANQITVEDPIQRFREGLKKLQAKPRAVAKRAFDAYNQAAADSGFPKAIKLTDARVTRIAARIREIGGMEQFHEALAKATKSSHCRGGSNTGWRMDFDFLCQPGAMLKILEGRYDNRPTGGQRGSASPSGPPAGMSAAEFEAKKQAVIERYGL